MHIDVHGQGGDIPVVLIHGWAMHGGVMAPLAEALVRIPRVRVHVVHLPGHGYSQAGEEGFDIADCVARLSKLCAIAGVVATSTSERARHIDGQLGDNLPAIRNWLVSVDKQKHDVIVHNGQVTVDGQKMELQTDYVPGGAAGGGADGAGGARARRYSDDHRAAAHGRRSGRRAHPATNP